VRYAHRLFGNDGSTTVCFPVKPDFFGAETAPYRYTFIVRKQHDDFPEKKP
jgi:hypothetical protein